jgi:hypothetical protein
MKACEKCPHSYMSKAFVFRCGEYKRIIKKSNAPNKRGERIDRPGFCEINEEEKG